MSFFSSIRDAVSNRILAIDNFRNLKVANTKRILGSGFGATLDTTYLYTATTAGTGAYSGGNGEGTIATGATANSSYSIVSKGKLRYQSGRNNLFRAVVRFHDTGTANNVREFGVYSDSASQFVFRLSGTTFSCVVKRNSVETVVSSGSFNGNGTGASGTYTVDTNYHGFEILYAGSRIIFSIDNVAIHTFSSTTASIVGSLVGNLYIANTNSGGSTSNVSLSIQNWSGAHIGDAVNNPLFYNINATAETRTLKAGGGTLQSISIGRTGGASCTLTLYDNTAGSGTIIGIWDVNATQSVGTHVMGIEGVNFYNGLTYVSSGTWTNGSVTIFWE